MPSPASSGPRKSVLFGSYAYGQPTPDSDVDLLSLCLSRQRCCQSESKFGLASTRVPLDLIVRKPEFVVRREREGICSVNCS